jgi:hypothetical protein
MVEEYEKDKYDVIGSSYDDSYDDYVAEWRQRPKNSRHVINFGGESLLIPLKVFEG